MALTDTAAASAPPQALRRAAGALLKALLREQGVKVVPCAAKRGPRQTHAGRTLERLYDEQGEAHVRDVLTLILESERNDMALVAPIISAVSDLLLAHGKWWQQDASAWLVIFDRLDLVEMFEAVRRGRAAVPARQAIATILHEELAAAFDPGRPHYRRDVPDPRPARAEKPIERRLDLSPGMMKVLQRAAVDGDGTRLPNWTRADTRVALARRGLIARADVLELTPSGVKAACELGVSGAF